MARKNGIYPTGRMKANGNGNGTANLGFETKLWLAADKLRGTMDAADYKHTVLGLIFLKYISDSFETRRLRLARETANPDSEYHVKGETQRDAVLEDRDEYVSEGVFWVPPSARWDAIQAESEGAGLWRVRNRWNESVSRPYWLKDQLCNAPLHKSKERHFGLFRGHTTSFLFKRSKISLSAAGTWNRP